mgnify:CR=1 FL=1
MAKSNIVDCGPTYIHQSIIAHAHTIKHENYKTNTTKQFQKHQGLTSDCAEQYQGKRLLDAIRARKTNAMKAFKKQWNNGRD